MEALYVLAGLLALVTWRGVELHFRDRRESRAKDSKHLSELTVTLGDLVGTLGALDEHTRTRLETYEKALTNSIIQFKAIVGETDAAKQKAQAANVLTQMRGKKLPTP